MASFCFGYLHLKFGQLSEFRTRRHLNGSYLSENHTTVNVRNPDVQISAFLISVRFPNCPAFRRCLRSGHKCPVIGRPVEFNFNFRLSDVWFQSKTSAETGSKPVSALVVRHWHAETDLEPVWNRFWH